jgi:hypothetical protein
MVGVVDELRAKLAEIDAKMKELRREIVILDDQKAAFEKVITFYDPAFELAAPPSLTRRASSRETASGRVTELLKGKNNRHIVLESSAAPSARQRQRRSPRGSQARQTSAAKRRGWSPPSPAGYQRRRTVW